MLSSHPHLKRLIRIILILLLTFVVVIAASVITLEVQRHRTVMLPAPTGPSAVGRVEYDWTDPSRKDSLAPHAGIQRELVVWSWYPAARVQGAHPAPYLPSEWAQASDNQLVQSSDTIETHSIDRAPLAPSAAQYPVLIFEPGMGKIPTQYTALLEDLASHGYVIFAITPTYSSDTVVFPSGRVAASSSTGNLDHAANLQIAGNQLVSVWAKDVLFVMDQLSKLNTTPGNLLNGHLDLTRLGVFGHSFGGATAAQVCHLDARCKVGIDIDGDLFGNVVQTGLNKPFMVIQHNRGACSDSDCLAFRHGIQAILRTVPPGMRYEISVKGTEHFNFSDYAVYFSFLRAFGQLGSIDGTRGLQITRAYVRAFFDTYLNNAPSPLLQGSTSAYPEVQFGGP
ncbi:alpha/beta hydrolase family protein [Dictyobacter arantiisoli]|uniref:Alpha/beta hydrolase n=1 Tax=Dictyobacter arantiisoli TaxID=2014874 RepID=A0A5A5TI75_9CHLR|nr:hypothetical protein [Dictyobacter arantiisoli]GCF10763.1 alpha/beta hydrolase [Dictyobacter arantiisoli]